jgi:predicted MFS family arabinose efflux permease
MKMDLDTVAEFQRRRRRAGVLMTPWILLAALGLALTKWLGQDRDWAEMALIAFTVCGVIGGLIGVAIFRCPRCEALPFDDDGVTLDPARCRKCGANLK